MLPRLKRLTRSEFSLLFPQGKKYHSPSLTLVYLPERTFKASAVIGKKVARTAVARNKFRRRVYAVFERMLQDKKPTGVFICLAKEGAATLTFDELRGELCALIHKTGVLG